MARFTLEERSSGIFGSDWSDIFSLMPYGCRRKAWYKKRKTEPDYPVDEKPVMERGTILEPVVAVMYSGESGRKVQNKTKFAKQPIPDEWGGHIDRMIVDNGDGKGPGVLECKTCTREVFKKVLREGAHESWLMQIQHYLAVTGWKWGVIAVLWPDGWQFKMIEVLRDQEMIDDMIKLSGTFWRQVIAGPEPEKLEAKDKRCGNCEYRFSCQGPVLAAMAEKAAKDDPGEYVAIEGAVQIESLVAQRNELKGISDEVEDALKDNKAQLMEALKATGHNKVMVPGARICKFTVSRNSLDTNQWKKMEPEKYKEIAEKYNKVTAYDDLRVYPS